MHQGVSLSTAHCRREPLALQPHRVQRHGWPRPSALVGGCEIRWYRVLLLLALPPLAVDLAQSRLNACSGLISSACNDGVPHTVHKKVAMPRRGGCECGGSGGTSRPGTPAAPGPP